MGDLKSVQIHLPTGLDDGDSQGAVSYGGVRGATEGLNNGSLLG